LDSLPKFASRSGERPRLHRPGWEVPLARFLHRRDL